MTGLQITSNDDWCTAYLEGIPPKELTERQWLALQQLASIHARRQRERGEIPYQSTGNTTGGWNLTARPAEFVKLHDIASGIIAHSYNALNEYRSQETA